MCKKRLCIQVNAQNFPQKKEKLKQLLTQHLLNKIQLKKENKEEMKKNCNAKKTQIKKKLQWW